MVAFLDAADTGANSFNNAGALVAQNHRTIGLIPTGVEANIGVAYTGGDNANEDFIVARTIKIEGLDPERLS